MTPLPVSTFYIGTHSTMTPKTQTKPVILLNLNEVMYVRIIQNWRPTPTSHSNYACIIDPLESLYLLKNPHRNPLRGFKNLSLHTLL